MTSNRIRLPAGRIVRTFGFIILTLAIAHVVMQSVRHHAGMPEFYGLVRMFDMGVEANLPTFFSAFQLLVVSLVLVVIGLSKRQAKDAYAAKWLLLALIFFLLAADEVSEIHEMAVRPFREFAPWLATGVFYWAWVLPATVLVAVVAWRYAGFVFHYLPAETRKSTVIGAALFVGGAIGVEMPEARYVEQHGLNNFPYAIFVVVEEVLEKLGILVFLAGLIRYCDRHLGVVEFEVVPAGAQAIPAQASRLRDSERPAV